MDEKQDKQAADLQIDLIADRSTDLTLPQLERVKKFVEDGLPGLTSLDDTKMYRMMELYLSGKSYTQISRISGVDKDIILYLSHKTNWYMTRREYLFDLNNNLQDRLLETRLISQNFLTDLVHFWHKKIGNKVNKYLATGDEQHANDISMKDIDKYLKTVEILQKLIGDKGDDSDSGRVPLIGVNSGENGVTVKKTGENQVEITPKGKALGNALKEFANLRREEEQKQKSGQTGNNE